MSYKDVKEKLKDRTTQCTIGKQTKDVVFISNGIKHCCQDMLNNKNFWVKNIILLNIDKYIKSGQYVGKEVSDTTHNTRGRTVNLKENTDYFYYFKIKLPNGQECYLHLGHYKENVKEKGGKMYLYSITKNLPKNIETI